MAIVLSDDGRSTVRNSGGTSASAPIWAALIALADQYAGRHLGLVNPAIYQIARGPRYHQAFHDVTKGNNTVQFPPKTITGYQAAPGWDPVTGWGSPDAQVLIPLLARHAVPSVDWWSGAGPNCRPSAFQNDDLGSSPGSVVPCLLLFTLPHHAPQHPDLRGQQPARAVDA
jgi:hypothetical protein